MSIQKKITIYTLEMMDPAELRPATRKPDGAKIIQSEAPSPEFNRFLYTAVGGKWFWRDRLGWSYSRWLDYLSRTEHQTWVAYLDGTPAGYAELEKQHGGYVEIVYFGLLPQFIGRGLGGYLLTTVIEKAWAMDAVRVWVHTCTLDHPNALANYQARGLQIVSTDDFMVNLPDEPPGPWPGAYRTEHAVLI
jgi:GNAT superfamily N-acetyltransferase